MMKLELKAIKHSAWASEETPAYRAKVYVNGKATIGVSNGGHGAPDTANPIVGKSQADIAAVEAYLKAEHGMELDTWCYGELDAYLSRMDMRRALNRCIVSFDGAKIYTHKWKAPAGWFKLNLETCKEKIRAKYPDSIILNSLAEAEAFTLWQQGV